MRISLTLWFLFLGATFGETNVIEITGRDDLRQALTQLRPGTTLKLRPGDYGAGYSIAQIQGTKEQPVVIEAADPSDAPVFSGGNLALHLQGCAHITLRRLRLHGQKGNGLNIDDSGAPTHDILLEQLDVSDVGPTGNCDGIKLSGLSDFIVSKCRITGWGGEGIDMVGCRRGLVEACHVEGKEGFSQATGVQTKGGSEAITIRNCTFINAGQRGVNLGGSTGRPYFRPKDAAFEARAITVEGCLFVGGLAPVAFVGVDDGVVRYNTFVNPQAWALRILQENREPGMLACADGVFEDNIIVVTSGALRTWVNIGPGTKPETFRFAQNWWFHQSPAQRAKPDLPAPEAGGTYGVDPELDASAGYRPRLPQARIAGHTAFKR